MKQQTYILDFLQGELAPTFKGRFDLETYNHGASLMENVQPEIPGGFSLRGGLFQRSDDTVLGACRLHPFIMSRDRAFVLEFSVGKLRFWQDGALVRQSGTPISVNTPYAAGDLPKLWFAQTQNVLLITCQSAPIKKLEYDPDTATITFGSLTITGNIGKLPFQPVTDSGNLGDWPAVGAFFNGRFYAMGTKNNPTGIWASKPFEYGNFTMYETLTNQSRQLREAMHLLTGSITSGSTSVTGIPAADVASVKAGDTIWGTGIVKKDKLSFTGATTDASPTITGVSSAVLAEIAVGDPISGTNIPSTTVASKGANSLTLAANATKTESAGVFQRDAVSTHVQSVGANSLVMDRAATQTLAAQILYTGWADPTIPEYENVTMTRDIVTEGSAFFMELASDTAEEITWAAAGKDLVIGTATGERIIPGDVSAVNLACIRQTGYGGAAIQPFLFAEALLFAEQGGEAIREYYYRDEAGAYQSPEITWQAKHLFSAGIKELDYQNRPYPTIWAVLGNGELRGCLFSRQHGAAAWYRLTTPGGTIEEIAVVPEGAKDSLYACVLRNGTRRLERLGEEGHLDASRLVTQTAGKVAAAWLPAGSATAVYNNKAYAITIAAGEASLPSEVPDGAQVLVGLPFVGRVRTMPAQAQSALGSAHLRPKAVMRAIARVLECYPFKAGPKEDILERAELAGPATGDYPIQLSGTWDTDGSVLFVMDEPLDVTVLAVAIELDAGG